MRTVPYPTPGEILFEEFLKSMQITQYRLANEMGVPQRRIGEIIVGKRSVTADTGLRLARFFGRRFLDRPAGRSRSSGRQGGADDDARRHQALGQARCGMIALHS